MPPQPAPALDPAHPCPAAGCPLRRRRCPQSEWTLRRERHILATRGAELARRPILASSETSPLFRKPHDKIQPPHSLLSPAIALPAPDAGSSLAERFEQRLVVEDAEYWWANHAAELTGDGLQDIVQVQNNANGGYLGYRVGPHEGGPWKAWSQGRDWSMF